MNISIVCIGLLGLLVTGLGLYVSLGRGASNTTIGSSDDPTDSLHKRVRAHGNAAEYCAILAVLIYVAGLHAPGLWVSTLMVAAVLSRYLHMVGMLASPTLAAPHPLRFVGALGTYATGIALSIRVVWLGLAPLLA